MKKILTVLAISFSALMASSLSTAAPQFDHDHPRYGNEPRGRDFRDSGNDDQQDRRRMREERGVKRLQQHKWQQGYVMPQHYRVHGARLVAKYARLCRQSDRQNKKRLRT